MLEDFFEGLFDKSAVMRALRKSAKKATRLGIADALGCNGEQGEKEMSELPETTVNQEGGKTPAPKALNGMPLPRPQLLGIGAAKSDDEPDQPGMPPKRIRQKRRGRDEVPDGEDAGNESPAPNGEKGEGK